MSVRTSFFDSPCVFSSLSASSRFSSFFIDLEIVLLFVSVPPSHLFETYGIPHVSPALLIASFTDFLVPTKRMVPDCAAMFLTKSQALSI